MSSKEEFTFVFGIEKFGMAGHRSGEKIASPPFVAFDDSEWGLEVYPRGNKADDEEYVSCFLQRVENDAGPEEVTVTYSLALIASDASLQETRTVEKKSMKKADTWGYGRFVKRDSLFKVSSLLLPRDTLTIRCHMVRVWPGDLSKQDLFVRTRIGCETMQFAWQLRNLSQCTTDLKRRFVVRHRQPEFSLTLYEADGIVKIEIRLMDASAAMPVVAFCRIAVVDVDGRTTDLEKEEFHAFQKSDEVWLFPSFLKREELKERGYLVDDVLSLSCSMERSTGTTETRLEKSVYGDQTRDILANKDKVLNNDMKQLLDGDRYQDMKLRVGSESLLAHQFVLHARSPVFKKMLVEKKSSGASEDLLELDICDVDIPTLKRMLAFIYYEHFYLNLQFASVLKLFEAADAYQVIALKEKCSTKLQSSIAMDNVCRVLCAARLHGDFELEECAVDFLANYWDEMSLTEEWEDFSRDNGELSADARRRIREKRLKE